MGHIDGKKFHWRIVLGYRRGGGFEYLPEDEPLSSSVEELSEYSDFELDIQK